MSHIRPVETVRRFKTKPLGGVFEVVGGGTPPKNKASYFSGKIPWATIRDMHSEMLIETEHTISEEGLRNSSSKLIPAGSVIMASRVGLGKACILQHNTAINQDIRALLPMTPNSVDSRFCLYWLQSVKDEIIAAGTGATVQGIKLPFIKSLPFPDVSIEEQERIVAVLDKAFAALDRARALAEANLADAEALGIKYMGNILSTEGQRWPRVLLSEICRVERGSSPRPIKNYFTNDVDGVNWVKIGDIPEGDKYVTHTRQKITKSGAQQSRYVNQGDFILTNSMSFGRPYIMKIDGYIHDGWFALRLNKNVDSDYLFYLISSEYVQNQFQTLAAGSVVKNISGDLVKKAILPMPEITIQKTVARKIAKFASKQQSIAEHYRGRIADIAALRQSLLQKAFAGELV